MGKGLLGFRTTGHLGWSVEIRYEERRSMWRKTGHPLEIDGDWITTIMYSFSGAHIISCFFDRSLRNVSSFWLSSSRTVLRAFWIKLWMRPVIWTVLVVSIVVFSGIPSLLRIMMPETPLWAWILFIVSSISAILWNKD